MRSSNSLLYGLDSLTPKLECSMNDGRMYRAWASDAPREIRDDVEVLADAAATLAATYADPSVTSTDEDVVVDTEAVEAASGEVLAFTSERCEVDLDPGTTVPAG